MNELAGLVARSYRDGLARAEGGGWTVEEAARGYNGIVFRARSVGGGDVAAKVSRLDERDRAGRELDALRLIRARGVDVVPEPLGVVREPGGVPVAVVLLRWRAGEPLAEPPASGSPVWERVIGGLAEVHRLELPREARLRAAMLGVSFEQVVEDMRRRLRAFDGCDLEGLVAAAERSVRGPMPPAWRSLIHTDANLLNVLVDDTDVTILDWENSGWGDACFDIGDLAASPQLLARGAEEVEPLIEMHAELLGDARLAARTRAHWRLMVAWWVVRLRQELSAPTPRLEGVHRPDQRRKEELLVSYGTWATELFGT